MFLLIQSVVKIVMIAAIAFKFHYVSINSVYPHFTACLFFHFKFHYVSINSLYPRSLSCLTCFFKFHYVSINSAIAYYETEKEATLNSIMFLLILHRNNAHKTVYVDFKFHYVSINSLTQKYP